MLYVTRGLVDTLLRFAAERDPDRVTVPLAVTRARDLSDADLPDETPVFTHFYMPSEGDAVNAVFGMQLGIPSGETPGIFVSHPVQRLELTKEDDLREVIFIAVPPWEEDSLAAFERGGDRQECTILDIEPPEESLTAHEDSG
ncbi:MAG: hypothetical protein ACI9K3_000427 [Halovenus sp.]